MNMPSLMIGSRQHGAASLAVSLILLFCMTLVVFFTNRGMVFEQKASANQYRSTRAFEMAEAGLEWATAMLNSAAPLSATCTSTGTVTNSFGARYAPRTGVAPNTDYAPPVNARAACRLAADGTLSCACPTAGTAPNVGTATTPSFTVLVSDEPNDPEAVRLTSWGCVNQTSLCTGTPGTDGDATALASVTLKMRPILRAAPAAPLTTGGWAQVCASFNITNQSAGANGYLVNSGGQTQIGNGTYLSGPLPPGAPNCGGGGGQTLSTLPGTPIAAAIVANDTSLSSISGDTNTMFAAFFGTTLDQYRAAPSTCQLPANSDGGDLTTAYNSARRCRDFWINGDLQTSGNLTLGSATDPVTIVSSSAMRFNGNVDIYGVIFSDSADWNNLGTGTSDIHGAVISRVNYRNNGNGTILYDGSVLDLIRDRGRLVRVPGTWRDFQ